MESGISTIQVCVGDHVLLKEAAPEWTHGRVLTVEAVRDWGVFLVCDGVIEGERRPANNPARIRVSYDMIAVVEPNGLAAPEVEAGPRNCRLCGEYSTCDARGLCPVCGPAAPPAGGANAAA